METIVLSAMHDDLISFIPILVYQLLMGTKELSPDLAT